MGETGRPVVWAGREDGPALVVIDPVRHDELPATWRRLAGHFQVAWCGISASEHGLEDVEDILETLTERGAPASLVASGETCAAAVAIAAQFADVVSAVLLVDPVEDDTAVLAGIDVEVRVIARASMALDHPDVVEALVTALAGLR